MGLGDSEFTCLVCGKIITRNRFQVGANTTGHWFCSMEHYWEWRKKNPVSSERQREAGSTNLKRKWADPEWRKAKIAKQTRPKAEKPKHVRPGKVEVLCANCGGPKMVHPCRVKTSNRFFCGRGCRSKWITNNPPGERHHGYSRKPCICANCGKTLLVTAYERRVQKNHFCPGGICYYRWMSAQSGEGTPHWMGGTEVERDAWRANGGNKWKRDCRRRDEWTCQLCGRKYAKYGQSPQVHHRAPFGRYPELRSVVANGFSVCRRCEDSRGHEWLHSRDGEALRVKLEQESLLTLHQVRELCY